MEENTQEESEISINIQETPPTPTQSPIEVGYSLNDIHTPARDFQPFRPILLASSPASYSPHPGYTQFSSSWTNTPTIPIHHLPATPEHPPLNEPLRQSGEEAKSRLEEEQTRVCKLYDHSSLMRSSRVKPSTGNLSENENIDSGGLPV